MISKMHFSSPINIDSILPNYNKIYGVSSEVYSDVIYCLSDHKFAILKPDGVLFCPVHETPTLIEKLLPELRPEAWEVYRDIKELGLESVWKS